MDTEPEIHVSEGYHCLALDSSLGMKISDAKANKEGRFGTKNAKVFNRAISQLMAEKDSLLQLRALVD